MSLEVQIAKDTAGHKIVVLPGIIFKNKQKMLAIATEKRFRENRQDKHATNAGKGWYYYTTRFAMPVYENDEKTDIYNVYSACLLINRTKFGKMYLYDLVDIKREASTPLKTIN